MKAKNLLPRTTGSDNSPPARKNSHSYAALIAAILLFSFPLIPLSAQVPAGFNYQALAVDNAGEPIRSALIQVRFTILSDTMPDVIIWSELHSTVMTNSGGLFSLVLGTGARQAASTVTLFEDIDWVVPRMFIRTEVHHNSQWHMMGSTRLWSVPYSLTAGQLAGAVKSLQIEGVADSNDESLFEVRNKNGELVFAVYNEGVRINVGDGAAKASKSGFAIGSFDRTKNSITDLFIVNRDSTRIYLGDDSKASKGGFAIGSFDRTKSLSQDYLMVSQDSVRVYIDNTQGKASKGGFAIGSFDRTKSGTNSYFDVSPASATIINPSEPRILWYPLKNAFLAGQVLIENSTDVGENSMAMGYETKAKGDYSQAMGYRSQALGNFSTAVGNEAIAERTNSFAFGQFAQAKANESYAFGRGAVANGYRSFAFGSAGVDSLNQATGNTAALGSYSFAMGMGSVSEGVGSVTLGLADTARGNYSVAIGYSNSALAYGSVALGNRLVASHSSEVVVGRYNALPNPDTDPWGTQSRIFVVGAGYRDNIRRNAMTVLGSGNTWFNGNISLYDSRITEPHEHVTNYLQFYNGNGLIEVVRSDRDLYFNVGGTYPVEPRMLIRGSSGNVGIGTLSTPHRLNVEGTIANTGSAYLAPSEERVGVGTTNPQYKLDVIGTLRTTQGVNLATSTGNIGVGTSTPEYKADIRGTFRSTLGAYFATSTGNVGVGTTDPGYKLDVTGTFRTTREAYFATLTGNVGVGTISPSEKLGVFGNIGLEGINRQLIFNSNHGYIVVPTADHHLYFRTGGTTNRMIIRGDNGRVGIGTASPSHMLTVHNGTTTGTYTIEGWVHTSDVNMKENINPLNDVLNKILSISGIRFTFKNDPEYREQIGFVAQDLERIFPQVVVTSEDGLKSVSYGQVSAILVEAIKEQQLIIDNQSAELDRQNSRIDALEQQLSQLLRLLSQNENQNQKQPGSQQ